MNLYEADFRHDWVCLTLRALKTGFESVRQKANENEWFDGQWQLEYAESILGIAFVTAQAYILGTVEDLNDVRMGNGKEAKNKIEYYSDDCEPLPNGLSRILLINSIANYYKHHDEWDSWPTNTTGNTLTNVGINENTEFPCYQAAKTLWGESGIENLDQLLLIASDWRKYLLPKYE